MKNIHVRKSIYIDIDGVLSNFDKKVEDLGWNPTILDTDQEYKTKFWKYLNEATENGLQFWSDMELLPGAKKLWDFVKPYHPTILSSFGKLEKAKEQKTSWIRKHFGYVPVILVRKSKDKALFACNRAILIDDREKSIIPWIEKGGIGILYTSAESAIEELQRVLGD
jgi:hypothetical protein